MERMRSWYGAGIMLVGFFFRQMSYLPAYSIGAENFLLWHSFFFLQIFLRKVLWIKKLCVILPLNLIVRFLNH